MADETKYLDIKIKETKALQYLSDLAKEVEKLKEKQKEAAETTGKTSKEYIALTGELKATQKEYNNQMGVLSKVTEANKATDGSLKQMKATLAIVSDEWNRLSEEGRLNTDQGKALTAQKAQLTEALKSEEMATGNAGRNVGFYADGIREVRDETGKVVPVMGKSTEATKDFQGIMGSLTTATAGSKEATSALQGAVGTLPAGFQKAGTAAKLLGKAMTFALGPIGLIIAAVAFVAGAVKSFYTSSEEGENRLTKSMNKTAAVWNVFNDKISDAGEAIVNFFSSSENESSGFRQTWDSVLGWFSGKWESVKKLLTNLWNSPRETFDSFVKTIQDKASAIADFVSGSWGIVKANFSRAIDGMLLTYEKFVGKFKDNTEDITKAQLKYNESTAEAAEQNEKVVRAVEKISNAVKNSGIVKAMSDFGDQVNASAAAMDRLSDRSAALAKAQRVHLVTESKGRLEISKLRDESQKKDEFNAETRLSALDKAIGLERKLLAQSLKLKTEEYNIIKETNALSKSTIEDKNKEAKALADLYKLQEQSVMAELGLQNQRQSLIKEINDDIVQSAEIELQLFIEKNRTVLNGQKVLNVELLEAEKARLSAIFNEESKMLQQRMDLGLIKQNEFDLAKLQKQNEFNDQVLDLDNQLAEQRLAKDAEALTINNQQELDYLAAVKEAQSILDNENFLTKLEADRVILEEKHAAEIANAEAIGADTLAIEKAYLAQKRKLNLAEFQAKASLAADFAGDIAQIAGENSKTGRIAAATATSINAIQSATAAFAALAPIPIVGPALGATAAAAALVSGFRNVKDILNTKSGLPGDSGGGGGGGAMPSKGGTMNFNNDIGTDLSTREQRQSETSAQQTVLVVDSVTAAQNNQKVIDTLSSL